MMEVLQLDEMASFTPTKMGLYSAFFFALDSAFEALL